MNTFKNSFHKTTAKSKYDMQTLLYANYARCDSKFKKETRAYDRLYKKLCPVSGKCACKEGKYQLYTLET